MQSNPKTTQDTLELKTTLSKISHEIRNPLALISSELQMLSSHHPEVEAYNEWISITDNVEYIKELLNDVSNYANAWRLNRKPTDLSQYLQAVLKIVSPTFDYMGIVLEAEIPSCLPKISIDQSKIRQALLNLLRNAQEAVPLSEGKIQIRVSRTDSRICITICDNGCGMTEEQCRTIFTPFVTYKKNGSGLGLAITRQIIEAHGGQIQVESTPHQGTSFHIFLGLE